MTEPEPVLEAWPPTLRDIKIDAKKDPDDDIDDERLEQVRLAAVALVEDFHAGRYNFADESGSTLPDVPKNMILGACRLAYRWHTRRRSPDALVAMGEMGTGRVPSFDVDIDRMLRMGRFAPAVIA